MAVNLAEMKTVVKEIVTKTDYVPCVIGHQGIGKSEGVRQIAQELTLETGKPWGFRTLNLASLEATDLMGVPVVDPKTGRVVFAPPAMIPWEENVEAGLYPEQGLLVLDELNRTQPMNRSSVLNLLNEKQVNIFRLAPGWKIVVTINPAVEGFNVHEMGLAEHSRLIELVVYPSSEVWLEYAYARASDRSRDVPDFIALQKDNMLFHLGRDEKNNLITRYEIRLQKTPDPRGWTKVMHILDQCSLPENLLTEVVSGIVGAEAATSFLSWRRNKERRPVPAKDVLERYESPEVHGTIRKHVQARNHDVLWATMTDVLVNLSAYVEKKGWEKAYGPNLVAFLKDLPEEQQLAFIRRAISINNTRLRSYLMGLDDIRVKIFNRMQALNAELEAS